MYIHTCIHVVSTMYVTVYKGYVHVRKYLYERGGGSVVFTQPRGQRSGAV